MQPVRERSIFYEQHEKPHVTFYSTLLDMKRYFMKTQARPPTAAKSNSRKKLREQGLLTVEWGSPDNL